MTCAKVVIPANASLSMTGHDWACNSGYRRTGDRCEKVVIPANASLSMTGHDWACNSGYRRTGDRCIPNKNPSD